MHTKSVNNLGNFKHERGCGANMVIFEYCFMHMDPSKASKNIFALYYNSLFFTRWMIFMGFGIMFWGKPRTMYSLALVYNVLWLGITILAMPSMFSPAKWWIMAEEIIILLWHLIQLIFFIDQGKYVNRDLEKYPEGTVTSTNYPPELLQVKTVRSYVIIIILFYLFCLVIEWVLFCKALTVKATSLQDENLNSEDVKMEIGSNDELNKRITNYKSIKSGKGAILGSKVSRDGEAEQA